MILFMQPLFLKFFLRFFLFLTCQAIRDNNVEFVKDALEKGANPDRTDWMGQSALHEACACGMTIIILKTL